ncbi:hypothetical protein PFISCL1PPCAC_26823, partial [Pristionchus fissidentatus]
VNSFFMSFLSSRTAVVLLALGAVAAFAISDARPSEEPSNGKMAGGKMTGQGAYGQLLPTNGNNYNTPQTVPDRDDSAEWPVLPQEVIHENTIDQW